MTLWWQGVRGERTRSRTTIRCVDGHARQSRSWRAWRAGGWRKTLWTYYWTAWNVNDLEGYRSHCHSSLDCCSCAVADCPIGTSQS